MPLLRLRNNLMIQEREVQCKNKKCNKWFVTTDPRKETCDDSCRLAAWRQEKKGKSVSSVSSVSETDIKAQASQIELLERIADLTEQVAELGRQNNQLTRMMLEAMQRGFIFQGAMMPMPQQSYIPSNQLQPGVVEPPKVMFDEETARKRSIENALAAIDDF